MTRVAVVQYRPERDRDANLARVERMLDAAAGSGADVVLLPELFSVPFVPDVVDPGYFAYGEPLDGPTNAMVARKSGQHLMTVVSSVFEAGAVRGVYHNTTVVFAGGEPVLTYRKSHLPYSHTFNEKYYFRPGDAPPGVVDAAGLRLGTVICYERHFPELGRTLALLGADLMVVPVAAASGATRKVFELELRAHAAFNEFYVAAANRTGREGDKEFFGGSCVVAPDGEVLAAAGDAGEALITADVDVEEVRRRRSQLPYFRDRRPELYVLGDDSA